MKKLCSTGEYHLSDESLAAAPKTEITSKQCSTCLVIFTDDTRFCPQDGTKLESSSSPSSDNLLSLDEERPSVDGTTTRTFNTNSTTPPINSMDSRLDLVGQVIEDRYDILETLGKGGMSVVFKARDRRLRKDVALKVLMPHLTADALSIQRFQQEATAASNLDHPNIVKVYNVGSTASGLPFMTMDCLSGRSLSAVVKDSGRLEYSEALNIFIQLADALTHAHEKGVIHRDLKPSNIIISSNRDESEVVKIVDFGIAKLLSQDGHTQAKLTQTGDVFGSPHYMSPEQCLGGELDERSDIYSMGCLMYEVLIGRTPHQGESTLHILHKHISETPPSFKSAAPQSNLPEQLEAVVFKCLERKREDRMPSMKQLKRELSKLYLVKDNNPFSQIAAQLSLAWTKRPKMSKRDKMLAAISVFLAIGIIGAIGSTYSFYQQTNYSPWLNYSPSWNTPAAPQKIDSEKVAIVLGNVDIICSRSEKLLKEGAETPDSLARQLNNVAEKLFRYGHFEDAVKCYEKAEAFTKESAGANSIMYANLLYSLGKSYFYLENYPQAHKYLLRVQHHNEWAASQNMRADLDSLVGETWFFTGNKAQAMDSYIKAMNRWKDYGGKSPRYCITAVRLADLLSESNAKADLEYARENYLLAKNVWEKEGTTNIANLAHCDFKLAQTMSKLNENAEALKQFEKANQEWEIAVGKENPRRAPVMMAYANALWQAEKYDKAMMTRLECWKILMASKDELKENR